jgi:hypothetical protein
MMLGVTGSLVTPRAGGERGEGEMAPGELRVGFHRAGVERALRLGVREEAAVKVEVRGPRRLGLRTLPVALPEDLARLLAAAHPGGVLVRPVEVDVVRALRERRLEERELPVGAPRRAAAGGPHGLELREHLPDLGGGRAGVGARGGRGRSEEREDGGQERGESREESCRRAGRRTAHQDLRRERVGRRSRPPAAPARTPWAPGDVRDWTQASRGGLQSCRRFSP